MLTIDDVRNMNLVAYEYVRGSMLYGTNVEGSDEDHGGVYIAPIDNVLGFDSYYDAQVSDEKHDNTYYEIKRWLELLCQSNPNALESLFVPENKIIGDIHPAIKLIRDNANLFLTKQCFKSFYGYASEQIKRARGLNKKMVNPVHEKKGVLDFCYVPHCQGSICITDWLKRYGLKQEYCGLVNIPNMHNMYAVFYDWGAHFTELDLYDKVNDFMFDEVFNKLFPDYYELIGDIFDDRYQRDGRFFKKYAKPIGYRGITIDESLDVRLSSIPKYEFPICCMSFNKDGYSKHCKQYTEYKKWEKNRNQLRYESNLNKNYDSKNMMHCVRLMHMAYEIAQGKGFNVDRTNIDREFLLDIRNHKFEYDYLINYLDEFKIKMEDAMMKSNLPDIVDIDKINELLIKIRKECL